MLAASRYCGHVEVGINVPHDDRRRVTSFLHVSQKRLQRLSDASRTSVQDTECDVEDFTNELVESFKLKPSGMESLFAVPAKGSLAYLPVISAVQLGDLSVLEEVATEYCESLIMDAMQLESVLGYTMTCLNVDNTVAIITRLLDAGLSYVGKCC